MSRSAKRNRLTAAIPAAVLASGLMVATACSANVAHGQNAAAKPGTRGASGQPAKPSRSAGTTNRPTSGTAGPKVVAGVLGTYQVRESQVTLTEPAHLGTTGESLGQRTLVTEIWYPVARQSADSPAAHGPFPLLMFAPGFQQCDTTYTDLLKAWAGAGYVVAAVNFPHTNCHVGAAANEADLVNQPQDVSYALTRTLALSAQPHTILSGLVDRQDIGEAGQSDGGDTVTALAADTCCTDRRVKAAAVLSGAEWASMPGSYFTGAAPPMLFVQGSADTINPPWTSVQLYSADHENVRFYLDLFGATHMEPYSGTSPVERLVARVTVDFFDRYVLGQRDATAKMVHEVNRSGTASLASGDEPAP
jgi:predicted dienelactone hydrolase